MPRGNGGVIGPANIPTTSSAKGVWSLSELTLAVRQGIWPSPTPSNDPYFEYTTLLLPGNGTNGAQNNTFLDGSTNNFTITRNGNTTQGTFSPFSQTGWGNYFDGSSYLANTSTTSVVAPGTSNFTAEFWVYATTDQQSQTYGSVLHIGSGTSGAWMVSLLYSSAGAMKIRVGTAAADYDSTSTISTNRWYYIALVREGTGSNQTKIYVDGSLFYTFTLSDNLSNSSALYIGTTGFNTSVRRLNGYVSNVRLTVGTALYTGAFTPSTTPLTTTSQGATATQVELLACQSNRFLDNSSNGWVFTTSGSPTVVAFSPFNPTASWSAATYGGSGYFDGSADYLDELTATTAFNLSTGDWTIEAWIYRNASGAAHTILSLYNTGGSNSGLTFYVNASNQLVTDNGVTAALAAGSVGDSQWVHMAIVRSGGTTTGYINGTSVGTTTQAASAAQYARIGALATGSNTFNGYIANLRIVKGTAVYTGAFTPPSLLPITNAGSTSAASYPSTTNVNTSFASSATSLLLNFTNAGIYDATSKNDLETVDGAQISNTTAKWGSTSIKFDGTGDWLLNQSPIPPTTFGSGDFSIEMWIYATTSGTQRWLFDGRIATPADGAYPAIYISSGNVLVYYVSAAARITGTTTITTNTWHFVQVIRTSGTTKMYLNGTQEGSNYTDSTVYLNPGVSRPIIGAATNLVQPFTGYIQDLRVTTGYARPTTTPTSAFPTL